MFGTPYPLHKNLQMFVTLCTSKHDFKSITSKTYFIIKIIFKKLLEIIQNKTGLCVIPLLRPYNLISIQGATHHISMIILSYYKQRTLDQGPRPAGWSKMYNKITPVTYYGVWSSQDVIFNPNTLSTVWLEWVSHRGRRLEKGNVISE